jgi:sugar phosphate isomerase/epimerase
MPGTLRAVRSLAVVPELELCCMTVRQASLPELIAVAGASGFGAVTTTPWLYARAGVPDRELRRLLDVHGVRVSYVDGLITALPGTPPPKPGTATEEDCFRIASALGASAINVVHIDGAPTPLRELVDALGPLCDRAAAQGRRIVVEFLPGTGIPDLATATALVGAVGAANLGVCLDSWHLARSGGTVDAVDPAAVGAVQLSDRTRAQDLQPYVPMRGRLLPGDGELPLEDLVARALGPRPDLPAGIEVISDDMRALPAAEAAMTAGASLQALLARSGVPAPPGPPGPPGVRA